MSNQDILEHAKILLSALNNISVVRPLIVGGVLRDLELGRKPKDIDILVKDVRANNIMFTVANFCVKYGYSIKDKTSHDPYYQDDGLLSSKQIKGVYELVPNFEAGIPIDVILVNVDPLERVRLFPCNASMIYMDSTGNITKTVEFEHFVFTGELHFYQTCVPQYVERMLKYFPDLLVTVDLHKKQ